MPDISSQRAGPALSPVYNTTTTGDMQPQPPSGARPKLVRHRVGSARDRARLEQACPKAAESFCPVMQQRLAVVQAVFRGDAPCAVAERFDVDIEFVEAGCAVVYNAGAEVFLAQLSLADTDWRVPVLALPPNKRRRLPPQTQCITPPLSPDGVVIAPVPVALTSGLVGASAPGIKTTAPQGPPMAPRPSPPDSTTASSAVAAQAWIASLAARPAVSPSSQTSGLGFADWGAQLPDVEMLEGDHFLYIRTPVCEDWF